MQAPTLLPLPFETEVPIKTVAARGALQHCAHLLANRLANLVCLVDALGENAHF